MWPLSNLGLLHHRSRAQQSTRPRSRALSCVVASRLLLITLVYTRVHTLMYTLVYILKRLMLAMPHMRQHPLWYIHMPAGEASQALTYAR